MVIVRVSLEVLGKILDALGEQCDLNLGGTGIALVGRILGDDLILDVLVPLPPALRCAADAAVRRTGAPRPQRSRAHV